MQLSFLKNYKGMIGGIIGVVVILVAGYYFLFIFNQDGSASVTQVNTNQALLGQNFALFLQVATQEKLSLSDMSFLTSYLIRNSKDFSQVIPKSDTRGREDPFSSYASFRPSR